MYFVFFFFKQKTAYEMRISDWSSDVCSSDLRRGLYALARARRAAPVQPEPLPLRVPLVLGLCRRTDDRLGGAYARFCLDWHEGDHAQIHHGHRRSEEHTSELQSLMRISYAVFCLKKKKNTNTSNTKHQSSSSQ